MHSTRSLRFAVIGAGAAGISAARGLQQQGHAVVVFDKGRRVGGRIALRRSEQGDFDHGAQSVQANSSLPTAMLAPTAVSCPWLVTNTAIADATHIGVPTMNSLASHWAQGLTLHLQCAVTELRRSSSGWALYSASSVQQPLTEVDRVILTVPAPQVAALLPSQALMAPLDRICYLPCWTLMWTPAASMPTTAAVLPAAPAKGLGWIVREDLKPGRAGPPRWLVHATAEWSLAHLELATDSVGRLLQQSLAEHLGLTATDGLVSAHRWRFGQVSQALGMPTLQLAAGLHYASDGCLGQGIAGAVASGTAAALASIAESGTR